MSVTWYLCIFVIGIYFRANYALCTCIYMGQKSTGGQRCPQHQQNEQGFPTRKNTFTLSLSSRRFCQKKPILDHVRTHIQILCSSTIYYIHDTHKCTQAHIHIHTWYTYTNIITCTCVCTHTHVYIHIYICIYIYIYTYNYIYIHIYINIYVYIIQVYVYTYIYKYIYIYVYV